MENLIIYARYSSHSQTEQSIEGQLRDCYAYAQREGYAVVGEYIDRALTGRSDDRPDFQRMIADARKKQFTVVLVWKLDRFARNRYDSAIYKAKLKKCGVRVVSAMENITDSPEGIILEGMLESMAEYYSANLSKNVKRGQRESVIKGTFTGGMPPLGYKVVDKKLVIDEDKAPIIRFAFEQYAAGVPKKKIVEQLTAKGIKNYHGGALSINSFQIALKNPKYKGVYLYGGQEVTGGCPAIISAELFDKVQEQLAAVAHAPAAAKARQEYLLQGKAFCGMCGTRLVGDAGTSKTGAMHFYYSCGKKKKFHTCKKKTEKKDFLEWYVCEQTVEYVLTPARMDIIAAGVVAEYDKEFNNGKISEYERKAAKLERDINKCIDDISATTSQSVMKRLSDKVDALELQKADVEIDISKLKIANGVRFTKEEVTAWMKQFCNGDLLDEAFRKRIIDVFINAIYLYDDKLVIYYNLRDSKQVSYIDSCDALDSLESGDNDGINDCTGVRISNGTPRH